MSGKKSLIYFPQVFLEYHQFHEKTVKPSGIADRQQFGSNFFRDSYNDFPFLFSFPLEMSRITETFYFSICDLLISSKQVLRVLENSFSVNLILFFFFNSILKVPHAVLSVFLIFRKYKIFKNTNWNTITKYFTMDKNTLSIYNTIISRQNEITHIFSK